MDHRRDERGQAYALEGIIGAVIIVSALVLGLQAVDIAPWTGSDERSNDELRTEVADALDAAQDTDALRMAVVCLDTDGGVDPRVGSTTEQVTDFGAVLSNTIADDAQYRMTIDYRTENGVETTQIGPQPSLPNQPTVTVSRYVALSDADPIFEVEDGECVETGETLADREDTGPLYLDSTGEADSSLFTVVRVRVIAW